jgi:ketosteroid isomerase-like protein
VYSWLARRLIRRMLDRQRAGDIDGLLRAYAPDVRFVFPGRSSWAADVTGRDAIEAWLRRFHRIGVQFEPKEILVSGPPWNTVVCVHFTDHVQDASGAIVYENRGVIFGRAAWGKLTYYTVYEDTQKVAEFDQYLAEHETAQT